jgi:hypothetical protein
MHQGKWALEWRKVRTQSLIVDGVPSYLNLIPVYGAVDITGEVLDGKRLVGCDTGN